MLGGPAADLDAGHPQDLAYRDLPPGGHLLGNGPGHLFDRRRCGALVGVDWPAGTCMAFLLPSSPPAGGVLSTGVPERLALIVCWLSPVGSEADVTWLGSALAWWLGGVVDEAGGALLEAPLVALLPGWPRPTGVRLDGVEAALGDLDQ
jgi:hypothetical protein